MSSELALALLCSPPHPLTHAGGIFSPSSSSDNGDNIFPPQWLPVCALGEGSAGFPDPVREPAQWRNESQGCLKAQPVSGPEGLAIHSLRIVLRATIGRMGPGPFVINSVLNFWWGNKSVTHLQLWIRTSFNPLLFSLSETLPEALLATSNVIFCTKKKQAFPSHHPEQRWTRHIQSIILHFYVVVLL